MRQKIFVINIVLIGLLISLLTSAKITEAKNTNKPLRVALVLPGPISDGSFNAAAHEGLVAVEKELGVEINFAESVPIAEIEETLRIYAQKKYEVIIGHGFQFGEYAAKVAPQFLNSIFLVTNGNVSGSNLASLEPLFEEAGYLSGVVAGFMTKSSNVGAIGGMKFPIIVRGIEAFGAGAISVNPSVRPTISYIGSLKDIAKGKEASLAQISTGIDIIFHIADEAGMGVIQACKEAGAYTIGFGFDQNTIAPKTVLTSFLVSYRSLFLGAVKRIMDGKFTGEIQKYGLKSGVVDLAPYHGLVPDNIAEQIEEKRRQIISGNVDIPRIDVPPQR